MPKPLANIDHLIDRWDKKPMIPFEVIERMRRLADRLYAKGDMNDAYSLASAIADIVQTTGKPGFYATTPFGVCPICGDYDELICLDRKKYAVCHEHRLYWYIGADYLNIADETTVMTPELRSALYLYTQIATKAAFPLDVCPCCGLFITHASWCIVPIANPDKSP